MGTKIERKNKLVEQIWEDIKNTWCSVDIPDYKREKLDDELCRCTSSHGRISLRALRKYSHSWQFTN
ncbi:MAG: hypothetical protein JW904_11005 [Spirochaetales bacterium]|nr:hypothetical protein [Spirochaetales bacterium]